MLIDYWKEFGNQTGISVEFKLTDWAGSLDLVKNNEADIHAGLFKTEERDEYLDFSVPLGIMLSTSLFSSNEISVSSLFNIGDINVGVIERGYAESFVKRNFPTVKLTGFKDSWDMLKAAVSGKISAFVSDYPTAMYYLHKTGKNENFHAIETLYTEELHAAVKEGNTDLLAYLNYAINNFNKDSREMIIQKWIQPESVLPGWVLPGFVSFAVFLVVCFTLLYIFALKRQVNQRTKELKELSQIDFLTKLYNRMKIESVLNKELYRLKRYNTPLSVILIDIDNFKRINDMEGHAAGDLVLIKFTKVLKINIRESDSIGRWGGEEFLIVCPDTKKDKAVFIAEKLCSIIDNYDFNTVYKCTASFGVTESLPTDTDHDIFRRADKALYMSKYEGKNRVTAV